MRGGHNSLPDAVKAARGTLKANRVNPAQPKLETVLVGDPPKGLRRDEKDVWTDLAASVDPMRIMTVADFRAFRLMVRTVALAERVAGDDDVPVSQQVAALKAGMSSLQHFGMDPASRGKVSAAPKIEKADPLAEFLS